MIRLAIAGLPLALFLATPGPAAASGCEVGVVAVSPDQSAVSVPFDFFQATPDEGASCNLSVSTGVEPAPGRFRVYSADYRGFVDDGTVLRLRVRHDGTVETVAVPGVNFGDEPFLRHYIGDGGQGTLDSQIDLSLLEVLDDQSLGTLDTIDYALAATTTLSDQQATLARIAQTRMAALLHLGTVSGLLTGVNRPLQDEDGIALIGGAGSYFAGAIGRRGFGDGWTLSGGAAYVDLTDGGSGARGVLAAGTVRYVVPGTQTLRPFGEAGVDLAALRLRFARSYDPGVGGISGAESTTSGYLASGRLRAGLLYAIDPDNEVTVSGSLGYGRLGTGAFGEASGASNLFAASFAAQSTSALTIKAGASWTTSVLPGIDVTLNGAAGRILASGDTRADIAFVGPVAASPRDESFVEYGARVGFTPLDRLDADVFVQGATGARSGTHAFVGGSLKRRF